MPFSLFLASHLLVPAFLLGDPPAQDFRAKALFEQAQAFLDQGKPDRALPLAEEALSLRERKGSPRGQEEAWSLVQVGQVLNKLERFPEAATRFQRALKVFNGLKDLKGQATTLNLLGEVAANQEQHAEALSYFQQALPLCRSIPNPVLEASLLNSLGSAQYMLNAFGEARDHFLAALDLYRRLGNQDSQAEMLKNLGYALDSLGDQPKAMAYYQEALALYRTLGNLTEEASTLNALGTLYDGVGEKAAALDLYHQALAIKKELKDERSQAVCLTNIGSVYTLLGDRASAVDTLNQALALHRKVKSKTGEAETLNYLGHVYRDIGETRKAITFYTQALPVFHALKDQMGEGSLQSNLGRAYLDLREPEKALPFLEKALQLFRTIQHRRGEGVVQGNLGTYHEQREEVPQALECFQKALKLHQESKFKGAEAKALDQIARLQASQAHPKKALEALQQARPLHQAVGDKEAELYNLTLQATLLPQVQRAQESFPLFVQAMALQDHLRANTLAVLSNQERQVFAHSFERARHSFIAYTFKHKLADPSARAACLEAWLQFKGAILESEGRIQAAVLESKDPHLHAKARNLQDARLQFARLSKKRPGSLTAEAYEQKLNTLREQQETLEIDLAKLSRAFAVDEASRRVDLERLGTLLPKGAAYLDFARVKWFDFETQKPAPARYVAFLFRPDAADPVRLVDLGLAEPMDADVRKLHQAIQDLKPVGRLGAGLHQRMIQPLLPDLKKVRQLFISPDGALNLVPFEILAPRGGRPLVERFALSYLTSGKDLARFEAPATTSRQIAILANPDFDLGLANAKRPIPDDPILFRQPRVSRDAQSLSFNPLPRTEQEAEAIQKTFPSSEMRYLVGKEATESNLRTLESPRILHLATHGFFLGSQSSPSEKEETIRMENPLLRSGLALAGANASIKHELDEGLFTAEKVLGLRLFGTDLVVLSACNTGVGKILDGEGVFGLKRAFIQVGARSLLVSLWPVPDRETKDLMTAFYQGLAKGETKAQALAEAKRIIRARSRHPLFWAGFVLVGKPD